MRASSVQTEHVRAASGFSNGSFEATGRQQFVVLVRCSFSFQSIPVKCRTRCLLATVELRGSVAMQTVFKCFLFDASEPDRLAGADAHSRRDGPDARLGKSGPTDIPDSVSQIHPLKSNEWVEICCPGAMEIPTTSTCDGTKVCSSHRFRSLLATPNISLLGKQNVLLMGHLIVYSRRCSVLQAAKQRLNVIRF